MDEGSLGNQQPVIIKVDRFEGEKKEHIDDDLTQAYTELLTYERIKEANQTAPVCFPLAHCKWDGRWSRMNAWWLIAWHSCNLLPHHPTSCPGILETGHCDYELRKYLPKFDGDLHQLLLRNKKPLDWPVIRR